MGRCQICHTDVESDGYGELVHSETLKYGCAPFVKGIWWVEADYPVAS